LILIIFKRYLIHTFAGLLLFLGHLLYSQEKAASDLLSEFQKSKLHIERGYLDSAVSSLTHIIEAAQQNKYWVLLTNSKIELARVYEMREDFDNTLKNYIELIRILQKNEIRDQLAVTHFALGQDYEKYKLYNKAIKFYALAKTNFEYSNNYEKVVESLSRQSDLYFILENYEMAENILDTAIQVIKSHETGKDIIPYLQMQIRISDRQNKSDKVLNTYLEILDIHKKHNDHQSAIWIQNEVGYSYSKIGDYKMALSILLESLEASTAFDIHDSVRIYILTNLAIAYSALDFNSVSIDTLSIVESYYKENGQIGNLARIQDLTAEVYLKQGKLTEALMYSLESIENAKAYSDLYLLKDCYKTLSDVYQESDDFKNGLKYYGLYSELNDSILRINVRRNLELNQLEQNVAYNERRLILEVMDEEIEEVLLDNQRIEIEKYQKEIELYTTEKALVKEAQKRRYLILIFIFLGCLLILIVIGYISKQKDNKLLKQQKESILNINTELKAKNDAVESGIIKLKETQSKLVESEKMASLGQLTAGVAHEINNPVNFISSNIKPLKLSIGEIMEILSEYRKMNDPDSKTSSLEKARELEKKYDIEYLIKELNTILDGINEGAERTKEIVIGLRNFSRLDKHELKEVRLSEMIDSTLVLLRNQYKDRIEIKKSYDGNMPYIQCYSGQLSQVFMNILSNAIQAVDGKGTISIETQLSGKEAEIIISDTGKGIPKDKLDNIFDPFYTTKEVGKGTGLGLSISYGIIQEHKGSIDVESEMGTGTRFKISIPVRQKE
jgi:signal transduction histidine kinase